MFRFICYFALSTLLLTPSSLLAQNRTSAELKEIVVSATRVESTPLEAPTFATVITRADIDAAPAAGLAELLGREAGVQVNDSGPAGTVKLLSLRGSTSAQVLVLLDGVRLNSSRDGGVDLSLLPFADIERIELVRGGGSSLYGADAVGGVVNLVTRRPSANSLSLKIVNGGYLPFAGKEVAEGGAASPSAARAGDLADTQKIELAGTALIGRTGLSAGGSVTRAANAYAWDDQTYLKDWRRRSHSALLSRDAYAGLSLPAAGGDLSLRGSFGYNEVEALGPLGFFSTDALQKNTAASLAASYKNQRFAVDGLSLDLKGFYRFHRLGFSDPVSPNTLTAMDARHDTHGAGLDLTQTWAASDLFSLTYGGAAAWDSVDSNVIGARTRINAAGFVELPVYLLPELTVTPSARYDYFSDFSGAATWRLAAVWQALAGLAFKAAGWSALRAPTMNDLYWPNDGFSAGNDKLKPETAYGIEGGLSAYLKPVSIDLHAFTRWIYDQIAWSETSPFFYQPSNIGRGFLAGAETRLRLDLLEGLAISAAYSWQLSFVLKDEAGVELSIADDRRLPYTPQDALTVGIEYRGNENRLSLTGSWVGSRFSNTANTAAGRLEEHAVFDASYTRILNKALSLDLTVKNLLNASYENQKGYPMPPLSIWTSLQVKL